MFIGLVVPAFAVGDLAVVLERSVHEEKRRVDHRITEFRRFGRLAVAEVGEKGETRHRRVEFLAEGTGFLVLFRGDELKALADGAFAAVFPAALTQALHPLGHGTAGLHPRGDRRHVRDIAETAHRHSETRVAIGHGDHRQIRGSVGHGRDREIGKAVLETIGADDEEVEAVRWVTFFIVCPSIVASPLFAIAETEICGGGGGGLVR